MEALAVKRNNDSSHDDSQESAFDSCLELKTRPKMGQLSFNRIPTWASHGDVRIEEWKPVITGCKKNNRQTKC